MVPYSSAIVHIGAKLSIKLHANKTILLLLFEKTLLILDNNVMYKCISEITRNVRQFNFGV